MSQTQLQTVVDFAASTDIALKSGRLKYTAEQPQEVMIAAERLLLHCLREHCRTDTTCCTG